MKKIQKTIAKLVILLLLTTPLGTPTWAASPDVRSPITRGGTDTTLQVGYHLQPDDTLQIDLRNRTEFSTKQVITPDGTISLPMVGRLKVQGLTLYELDTILKTEYAKYVQNPMIVTYLIPKTPTPIFVVQHNLANDTWQAHTAESPEEAMALCGGNTK